MEVDARAMAFTPARWSPIGLPVHDAVIGKILHIDRTVDPKLITLESINHDGLRFQIKVPDYRIKQFTFGGVWVANGEYDEKRIEAEDKQKLESELKKKKK